MGNSPFKMPGMAFKGSQTPIKKITLKKVLGKLQKKVESRVENLKHKVKRSRIGKALSKKDNNGNGNGNDVASTDLPTTPVVKRSPAKVPVPPVGRVAGGPSAGTVTPPERKKRYITAGITGSGVTPPTTQIGTRNPTNTGGRFRNQPVIDEHSVFGC